MGARRAHKLTADEVVSLALWWSTVQAPHVTHAVPGVVGAYVA